MMAKKLLLRFQLLLNFIGYLLLKTIGYFSSAWFEYEQVLCKQHLLFIHMVSVNIQVQHSHMTETAAADQATVELIVNTLHNFFPSFDYRYCYDAIGC